MSNSFSIGSLKGQLISAPTLKGKISIPVHTFCDHDIYDGEYVIQSSDEQVILSTAGKLLKHDIVIEPFQCIIPPGTSMATDEDIRNLINEILGDESEMKECVITNFSKITTLDHLRIVLEAIKKYIDEQPGSQVYVPHVDIHKIMTFTVEDKAGDIPDPVDLNPNDEWGDIGEEGKTDYIWEDMDGTGGGL